MLSTVSHNKGAYQRPGRAPIYSGVEWWWQCDDVINAFLDNEGGVWCCLQRWWRRDDDDDDDNDDDDDDNNKIPCQDFYPLSHKEMDELSLMKVSHENRTIFRIDWSNFTAFTEKKKNKKRKFQQPPKWGWEIGTWVKMNLPTAFPLASINIQRAALIKVKAFAFALHYWLLSR